MYSQRPRQGPPPTRMDNPYPPQAADWRHHPAEDGYYDYGYDDDHSYGQYYNGRYDDAGYDNYGPSQPMPSFQHAGPGFAPQMEQPYGHGQLYHGNRGGRGHGPNERNGRPRAPSGARNMRMDRPQPPPKASGRMVPEPGAQPPPGTAMGGFDGPFPAFPQKPKRRAPPPNGIVTDMAAMRINDAPPDVMGLSRSPQARRPSIQRQQPGYHPMQGQPTRLLGADRSARPMRSASDRQPAIGLPSDYGPYGHHRPGPERSFTFVNEPDPPTPVPHVARSVTMPIPSPPPVSPSLSRPMYPGQATYQEPVGSSPVLTQPPVLPRPSTAGGYRPNMARHNLEVSNVGRLHGLAESVSEPPTPYGPHSMTKNDYGASEAGAPEMPNFDAMPDANSGTHVDESLPGLQTSDPSKMSSSPGGGQYAAFSPAFSGQAQHGRSQPSYRGNDPNEFESAGFQFGFSADFQPVPPPSRGYGSRRQRPDLYEEPVPANVGPHYRSRSPIMPIDRGYPQRGPTPQPYGGNGPPRPYRVNTPMPVDAETPDLQNSPDALPHHPAPFRPGLAGRTAGPAPVRQNAPQNFINPPPAAAAAMQGSVTGEPPPQPVTHEELQRLQQVGKSKQSDPKTQLLLAKKLVEASVVLVKEDARMNPKTKAKVKDKYISDAYRLVKRLVSNGYAEAQFYLADCYGHGALGLQVDHKEAYRLYQSAAKQGHLSSAYRVAVCCEIGHEEGGGTKRDPLKAVQWYKRSASLGYPPAMYKVGMILLKGLLGQPRDPREGVSWLKRAAERADAENPHALHELALMYENARPNDMVMHDEDYACQLFHQAAELGYKFSQFRLGAAYEYGLLGCPVDQRSSIIWYSRAAAQGEHQSELALSGWYLTGSEGILQQSDTEAFLWARRAASAGLPKAEYAMGYFTEVGIGASPNLDDAKRWYWRAAAQGFPKARERLEDLKKGGRMERTRLSRSAVNRQGEGDCVVM